MAVVWVGVVMLRGASLVAHGAVLLVMRTALIVPAVIVGYAIVKTACVLLLL